MEGLLYLSTYNNGGRPRPGHGQASRTLERHHRRLCWCKTVTDWEGHGKPTCIISESSSSQELHAVQPRNGESYDDETSDFPLHGQVLNAWHNFRQTPGAGILVKKKGRWQIIKGIAIFSDHLHIRLLHLSSGIGRSVGCLDIFYCCTT